MVGRMIKTECLYCALSCTMFSLCFGIEIHIIFGEEDMLVPVSTVSNR